MQTLMERLIAEKGWSDSPIGPPSGWPRALKMALSIALPSPLPMIVSWGPELCVLYNEACIPIFGGKHPHLFGKTGLQAWGEGWDRVAPLLQGVMQRGGAARSDDQPLVLERSGVPEEAYLTWSCSPLPDDSGGVGGVLAALTETTERVIGQRRLETLGALDEARGAQRRSEACRAVARALERNLHDLPFTLLYLREEGGGELRLAASTGLAERAAQEVAWPLAAALDSGTAQLVDLRQVGLGDPVREALVLPLPGAAGALVLGASPRRPLDEGYRGFCALVASHVDHVLSAAQLHQAETERDRFRALLAQTPAIVNLLRGPDLVFEFVHPLTEEAVGGRSLLGKPLLEAIPEHATHPYPDLLRRVLQTGEPWSGHELLMRLDRGQGLEDTYWDSLYLPVHGRDGSVEAVMTFEHEVTEKVRARSEQQGTRLELEEANARLQLLSDTSLALTDRSLSFRERMQRVARLIVEQMGDACQAALVSRDGQTFSLVALEHDDPERQRAHERLAQAELPVDHTSATGRMLLSGEPLWVPEVEPAVLVPTLAPSYREYLQKYPTYSVAAVPLAVGGKVLGSLSMSRYRERLPYTADDLALLQDVAVRVALVVADDRQREAIERSEVRFRSLIAASAQVVWTAAPDGAMVEDSPTWRAFTGQPLERWLGSAWLTSVHPEDRERVRRQWEQAVESRAVLEAEYRLRRPEGGWSWTIARAVPVRSEDGALLEWVGTNTDITERKRLEAEAERERARLREARAEAEAASRAKDEFLAMLGHELRNPLAPILTALHLMRLRGLEAHKAEREVVERQVKHVVRLVDDLLEVSRITRGKVTLERSLVDLGEILAQATEMASPLVELRKQHLTMRVSPNLTLRGDPARLAQVFANLLTNASKYTPEAGHITVTAEARGDQVRVSVRDTGIGIRPEMLGRIFELFEQERQELDRARGGLGLGLSIVRSLVSMHGGTVEASSAGLGEGSEFVVELPRSEDPVTPAPVDPWGGPGRRGPGRRVLVVDDNRDAAQLLSEALRAMGHQVQVAHDGPEALAQLEVFLPEVALLDIGLPVMDGYELARRIRAHPRLSHARLLAVTGYGQARDREEAAAAGFDGHFVKPVDLAELERAVSQPHLPG
jgi:PAS domain S-box-containing protein